jgi:hypothetical protein
MQHVCGRGEMCTGFYWGNTREGDHLDAPGMDGRIILKWILEKWDGEARTDSIRRRIETGGGLL